MMLSEPVRRLATVVSIAARIEPELLRAARLRLLPDVDVSAEGDLWFSSIVASRSTRRVVLDTTEAAALRQELARDRALLNAARNVLLETHRNAPPAIQLEEEILYLALTGDDVGDAINTKLTSVLNAIATENRRGLIDWAARALPSMPAIVQNTTAAAALRLVAGGEGGDALFVSRDPAIAALVASAVPKTTVYARLAPRTDGFCVEINRTEMPASHAIELPKTEPLVLELTTASATPEIVEIPREGTLVRDIGDSVSLRTIAGDLYELDLDLEDEPATVRILVITGLNLDAVVPPDARDIDIVLIAGNVAGAAEEYHAIADRLRDWFGTTPTPILAVRGGGDTIDERVFADFLARLGFTTGSLGYAKSLQIGTKRIGVVGLDTADGEFEGTRISNVCGGDPFGWARSHDAAILMTWSAPEDLDDESRQRWEAFAPDDVFDFIATGSRNTPDLTEGYVIVEFPDPDGMALVSTHRYRGGESQIRREALHEHTVVPFEKAQSRRVLVAGIAESLSLPQQELCRAIGSLLALQGHELITGGWPGVDYLVAEGFDRAAPNRVESITHYLSGRRKESDFPRGKSIYTESDEEATSRAVSDADVVILIEGASGTRDVGNAAISQGKPVIPIGGGAAGELRPAALRRDRWPTETIDRLARLGEPAKIATIVHDVNFLIREARPFVPVREPATPARGNVFVSASDWNSTFVAEFVSAAEPFVADLLNDTLSLVSARCAVVFMSASYLEDKRRELNLRAILERARRKALTIFWFLEDESNYMATGIEEFRAAHDVTRPLNALDEEERRAIFRRVAGEIAERLRIPGPAGVSETIASILAALGKMTPATSPLEWARLMMDLGDAYLRESTPSTAIRAFEAALQVYRNDNPIERARGLTGLAAGFRQLEMKGEEDLDRVTAFYQEVLEIYKEHRRLKDVGATFSNLAATYRELTIRDRAENLARAADYYHSAFETFSEADAPREQAVASERAASIHEELASINHSGDDRTSALSWYERAARLFENLGLEDHARDAQAKVRELTSRTESHLPD